MTRPRPWVRRSCALVAALCVPIALSACGSSGGSSSPPVHHVVTCPLTGTPAPGGVVPRRPALVVKVDNYSNGPLPISPPYARPQTGLNAADVIFEEQVEGVITRYAAVFQCHAAPLVGDVRSARQLDIGILSELGHPLLVHVGGIVPVLDNIDRSAITNVDLSYRPALIVNPAGRYPPYDDFVRPADVWRAYRTRTTPPAPIFTYAAHPIGGRSVSTIHLDWSTTSDIFWQWHKATGTWLRSYDNAAGLATAGADVQPDLLSNGVQNQAQNVIIQLVHVSFGPWFENDQGGKEVEAPIANSSGVAYVFRNGRMIAGTWTHGSYASPTVFRDGTGREIPLAPGRTWVEVYPVNSPDGFASPITVTWANGRTKTLLR